nr:hypothetical protein [Tanacetum cinerariifolium]
IEYVEAPLPNLEIISVEEQEDVVLREKRLSIIRLISNIEFLNDNSTPDRVLNSFESDNSLLDTFSPEFETFCDHSEETRSGNTTHADNSLPEYDSFCFEIEPNQERLINLVKNDIPDNSSNDPFLEETDLFLAVDNSIPPGIENFTDDPEGDIYFLEDLLIDDSILYHESSDSNFEDNPLIPRPPPEPPDVETDAVWGSPYPFVGNKMNKAFPLLVRKFPLPEGTFYCLKKNATARRKVLPLPEVCTAIIVKEKPSVKDDSFL